MLRRDQKEAFSHKPTLCLNELREIEFAYNPCEITCFSVRIVFIKSNNVLKVLKSYTMKIFDLISKNSTIFNFLRG